MNSGRKELSFTSNRNGTDSKDVSLKSGTNFVWLTFQNFSKMLWNVRESEEWVIKRYLNYINR
jgi:hypothetical protein